MKNNSLLTALAPQERWHPLGYSRYHWGSGCIALCCSARVGHSKCQLHLKDSREENSNFCSCFGYNPHLRTNGHTSWTFRLKVERRNWDKERERNKDHNKTLTQNFVSLNLAVRPSAGFTYALYPFVPWFFCLNHYQQKTFWIILISVVLFPKSRGVFTINNEEFCQGASFTKISTFSAPGALRANHAWASRHLGVRFWGNLEGIYGHFGCFTVDFGKRDNFSCKLFGWFLFLFLSLNHEDPWKSFRPKDIQPQPQGTEKQPQNPGSWLRYRLSISCWTSTAQGRKKQHCHLVRKDLRALDSKRWKHLENQWEKWRFTKLHVCCIREYVYK